MFLAMANFLQSIHKYVMHSLLYNDKMEIIFALIYIPIKTHLEELSTIIVCTHMYITPT